MIGLPEIRNLLHSYKVGEAEPIEDWGKGHTLVNPEPTLKEQALKELQQLPIDPERGITCSALETIRQALEALPNE
jgi:hypothetical protein